MATIDVVSGEINDPEAAQACDGLVSYLALEAATVQIEKERHYRKGSLAEQRFNKLRSEAKNTIRAAYSNSVDVFEVDSFTPAAKRRVLDVLDVGGIAKALEEFPDYSKWLARLSLSTAGRTASFEDTARQWGATKSEVKEWVNRLNSTVRSIFGEKGFLVAGEAFGFCEF